MAHEAQREWGSMVEGDVENIRYVPLVPYLLFTSSAKPTLETPLERDPISKMKQYGSLVEIKPLSEVDSDTYSDVSKEDAEATTSLLRTKRPLGRPEVTKRLWFSKIKANPGDDIATQVCMPII